MDAEEVRGLAEQSARAAECASTVQVTVREALTFLERHSTQIDVGGPRATIGEIVTTHAESPSLL